MMRRSNLQVQNSLFSTPEPRRALGVRTRLRVRTLPLLLTCP